MEGGNQSSLQSTPYTHVPPTGAPRHATNMASPLSSFLHERVDGQVYLVPYLVFSSLNFSTYFFSASAWLIFSSTSFCHALCFAFPLIIHLVSLVYENSTLTAECRQRGSYLEVEDAGLGSFADVFAAGDLVQAVEL